MEEILKIAENIAKNDYESNKHINIYQKISEFKPTDKNENKYLFELMVPKIHDLCKKNLIQRDILYLSLIGNRNFSLLENFISHHECNLRIDLKNATTLYDYCVCKNDHWFKELLTSDNVCITDKNILNKILTLQLINFTNFHDFDLNQIQLLLSRIDLKDIHPFWKKYAKVLKYFVRVIEYFKTKSLSASVHEVFCFFLKNSILHTCSNYTLFRDSNLPDVLKIIQEEEDLFEEHNTESSQFEGYMILGHLYDCITQTTTVNVSEIVGEIKERLLNLSSIVLQLELLEAIFAFLFMPSKNDECKHICRQREVRLILYLVKEVLDEIKLKNVTSKDSPVCARVCHFNKIIADAMWRMELIMNVKSSLKCEQNLLKYMLSSPESLILMCLKRSDFERAFQVIKIFSLEDPHTTSEIKFSQNLVKLREGLKKTFKVIAIQKVNPNISVSSFDLAVDKSVGQFFKRNVIEIDEITDERIGRLSKKFEFFSHFSSKNQTFMNLLDLAITLPQSFETSESLLQLACENNSLDSSVSSTYSKFCKRLIDLYKEVGRNRNASVTEVLISPEYNADASKYIEDEKFYEALSEAYDTALGDLNKSESGILNRRHFGHKSVSNIDALCTNYSSTETRYLAKLYNYLRAFSRILYIEQNTSDIVSKGKNASYFDLLKFNRSELMGKLLFERNLDPGEFEKYFAKLKLDYLYHVAGNCFPTINLHVQENVSKDELYPENSLYVPNKGVITYIRKRNWLLAYVLIKMYDVTDTGIDVSEVRVRAFENYLGSKKIELLKRLYDGNAIVAALQNEVNVQKISDVIDEKMSLHEKSIDARHHVHDSSDDSCETGEELKEDTLNYIDWKEIFDMLRCIPEEQAKKDGFCSSMTDTVLVNLIRDAVEPDHYEYVRFISDRDARITVILDRMNKWPGDFCSKLFKSELTRFDDLQDGKGAEMNVWSQHIDLCEKLKVSLNVSSWYEAYRKCEKDKESVICTILEFADIDILLDFIELHTPNEDLLEVVDEDYFSRLFANSTPFARIKQLLDHLSYSRSVRICYALLRSLKHLEHLQSTAEYLLSNVADENLKNVMISLKMLSVFAQNEQEQLLGLLYEPLAIVEILIMNTKLDKLAAVLLILKVEISRDEFNEEFISVEKIDEVLRSYAEKSLDFRVITQPNPRLLRTPDFKLMQSLDSLNFGYERVFVMPDEVPVKDDWVPNDEVLECMCCLKIAFSMFNRRHHCRRCGRVVCYNCSLHRMLVPSYGDILVRVCLDCYKQTVDESETSEINDSVSTKSIVYDYWLLTDDPLHNKIVREEFSYEHAPSVSLCLSLMKYHSKTIEYPKFLLDQCNVMLKLLQPSQEPIQEIDYLLVIKMLKSLAMAAKMSSTECTLLYGTSLADRILSQADLLSLLAERGCLSLLPVSNTYSQGPYIDSSVLRRLRDRLLEREQWHLALEVSTKAGLDNTGVFAVWGKSCLKAGCLQTARDKFQRCFDKTAVYDNLSDYSVQSDNSESFSRSRNVSRASNLSSLSESKPAKNPPLLNEIIRILETNTRAIDPVVLRKNQENAHEPSLSTNNIAQSETAVCILNKLKNLHNVSNKIYYQPMETEMKCHPTRPTIHQIFFDECVYYLNKYGSHLGLLEFYVKHGDIDVALNYIIDNSLGPDVFVEIYLRCLKDGIVGILQEHISLIDSTLEIWKEYLRHICRHLEKNNLLHSLYQLQQFMGDSIRAAMTCIRFYQENVSNFGDFLRNAHFLDKAEEHLQHVVEQEQWVDVATVRKVSSGSRTSFEEKGIINPSIVMKISTKDINKHIKTIGSQKEVAEFLASCEESERYPIKLFFELVKSAEESVGTSNENKPKKIPTLFGSTQEKIYLAVMAIVCKRNIEEGFEIALKLIHDLSLKPIKIFCEAGKQLAKEERYGSIGQLVNCIKQSGTNDNNVTDMCDEMLTQAVATFTKANVTGTKVEDLIKLISDKTTKISAYIEAKQLKTAYFLAVKYKRMADIRRILREAELLNQPSIKALCQKVLQSHSHAPARSSKE